MAEAGIPSPAKLVLTEDASAQAQQWDSWVGELQIYFEAANITAAKRKRALLLYLGGERIRNIYDTYEDTDKTFDSAKLVLDSHFELKKNVSYERFKFNSSKIHQWEGALSYITRLRQLVKTCKFEEYSPEDAIVDHFISTCDSASLRKKLLSEKDLDIDKLVEIASTVELIDRQSRDIEKQQGQNTAEEVHAVKGKEDMVKGCYGCGLFGHRMYSSDCPAREARCFVCGNIGHYSKCCQARNQARKGTVHCVEIKENSEKRDEGYLF